MAQYKTRDIQLNRVYYICDAKNSGCSKFNRFLYHS